MKEYRFAPEILLDHDSIIPLRGQIITQMRQAILRYRVKPGTRVISERALAMKLCINRNTVHQAYEELVNEGLLSIQSPRGGVRISSQAQSFYVQAFPTIHLIMPYSFTEQIHHRHFSHYGLEMFGGILDRAAERQVSVQILTLPPPETPPEQIRGFLDSFVSRSTGLITMGRRFGDGEDPVFTEVIKCRTLPHVFVSAFSPGYPYISTVNADLSNAVNSLLDRLEEQKITSLGVFPGKMDHKELLDGSAMRWAEVRKLALKRNFTVKEYPLNAPPWQEKSSGEYIRSLLKRILQDPCPGQCLVANNDDFACILMDELREEGRTVPGDFLLVGYDDLAPEKYSLSSLNHSRKEMGALAVDTVLELAGHHCAGEVLHKTVPTTFTARGSTEKPH